MEKLTEMLGTSNAKKLLGLLSLALVAGLVGRATCPARIETREVTKVEYVDRIKVEKVYVEKRTATKTKAVKTEFTKVTAKDGTVTEHRTYVLAENTKNETVIEGNTKAEQQTAAKSETEKTKVVSSRDAFMFGPTVGTNGAYGALVGARVLGPFWAVGAIDIQGKGILGITATF